MFAIMQQMLFVPADLVGFNGVQKALCLSRSLAFISHVIAVYFSPASFNFILQTICVDAVLTLTPVPNYLGLTD